MLLKFNNGATKQTDMLITGDETWIYDYDPETKIQSATWCFPGESSQAKVRRSVAKNQAMVAVFFTNFSSPVFFSSQSSHCKRDVPSMQTGTQPFAYPRFSRRGRTSDLGLRREICDQRRASEESCCIMTTLPPTQQLRRSTPWKQRVFNSSRILRIHRISRRAISGSSPRSRSIFVDGDSHPMLLLLKLWMLHSRA